ncbi:PREDICTED: carbohydrate sulfotransferase 13-like [Priapulus caudatus]|uniref:Carbohydrate sulfotransferase n=1 Tax=Priapulus caudatus TaxID=37621 RepID=A0ABM1EIJ8_PRICU|nr:PREDICTED: carbohydrate sulfotransferase 13-like [Priapulus caudatus]
MWLPSVKTIARGFLCLAVVVLAAMLLYQASHAHITGTSQTNKYDLAFNQLLKPPQQPHLAPLSNETENSIFADEEEVYKQRKRALYAACITDNRSGEEDHYMHSVIADDKHRLLYCTVPRDGSRNMLRTLVALRGDMPRAPIDVPASSVYASHGFPVLGAYAPGRRQHMLREYTKLLVVRNPFERVLSAYSVFATHAKELSEDSARLYTHFRRYVAERYGRGDVTQKSDGTANVTFAAFVRYLTDPRTRRADPLSLTSDGSMNPHWIPITERCAPCSVRYDVIVRLETFARESGYLLRRLNASGLVEPPPPQLSYSPSSRVAKMRQHYAELNELDVLKLRRLYERDFKLFQYNDSLDLST